MRLPDFAESLKQKIDAMALPGWAYSVRFDSNLMDSVHVRFADQPKEKWPNGIWHNANGFLLMIDERGRQREVGRGPYQMIVSTISGLPRMIGKSGTLEQIEKHIMSYLNRLKTPPAPKPVITPDKVVESLLESNGVASLDDEAADNIDDYSVLAFTTSPEQTQAAKLKAKELGIEAEPLQDLLRHTRREFWNHIPDEVKTNREAVRLCWTPVLGGEALELEDALRGMNIFAETESVLD